MHNVPAVQVLQGLQQLAHDAARIGLTARAVVDEIVEELAAVDQLHHEAELALGLEHVPVLDDVRMREGLEDARLGQDLLFDRIVDLTSRLASQLTRKLLLLHALHRQFAPRFPVHDLLHDSERSPPELGHLVVVARRAHVLRATTRAEAGVLQQLDRSRRW